MRGFNQIDKRIRALVYLLAAIGGILLHSAAIEGDYPQSPAPYVQENFRLLGGWINRVNNSIFEDLTAGRLGIHPNSTQKFELSAGVNGTTEGARLVFAHFGDGKVQGTNLSMITEFFLVNTSTYDSKGTICFFDNQGDPLRVTINGQNLSQFPINVPAIRMLRVATSGQGGIKSGWALVRTDQPLAGTASFSLRDPSGEVTADVGVSESSLQKEFTLFADTRQGVNTGVAVANPSDRLVNIRSTLLDKDGVIVTETSFKVVPMGHRALFVNELFPKVPGIRDFEGSILLKGDHEFGGITLRTVGTLMTSVPMVGPPMARDQRTHLFLPQVANGAATGLKITTTILLFNPGSSPATGNVRFLRSDTTPMEVTIRGQSSSSFEYSLPPLGVERMTTNGASGLQVGWGTVEMDQPIAAAAIFHIFNGRSELLAEVGVVPPPQFGNAFSIVADSRGTFRTGLAIVNTDEEEQSVTITLVSSAGKVLDEAEVALSAMEHRSVFVDELFGSVPQVDNMEGFLHVAGSESVFGMGLRQAGVVTTSLPSLLPVNGFSPVSTLDFAQDLVGITPLVRWRVVQGGLDLSLERLKASAAEIGLDKSGIKLGDKIGYGTYILDLAGRVRLGGIVELIVTTRDGLEFDVVCGGPALQPGTVIAEGRLDGTPSGGFTLELGPNETRSLDWNKGIGLELDMSLLDGLFVTPNSPGVVQIATEYTSASAKLYESDARLLRRTRQDYEFHPRPAQLPFLTQHAPIHFQPGDILVLSGGNFTEETSIIFDTGNGSELFQPVSLISEGELTCDVPSGVMSSIVGISNAVGRGRGLWTPWLFGPTFDLERNPTDAVSNFGISLQIHQRPGELTLEAFDIRLFNLTFGESTLSKGMSVGEIQLTTESSPATSKTSEIQVISTSSDQIELESSFGTIVVRNLISEDSVEIALNPDEFSSLPSANGFSTTLTMRLDRILFSVSSEEGWPLVRSRMLSGPSQMFGSGSEMVAQQFKVFKEE